MKIECEHCRKSSELNLQFLIKSSIEIECPHCHEMMLVESKDKQKQELQDTHPLIREAEFKKSPPKVTKTIDTTERHKKKYWYMIPLVILIGLIFWRGFMDSSKKSSNLTPPSNPLSTIPESLPEPSKQDTPTETIVPMQNRQRIPEKKDPLRSYIVEIESAYVTFAPDKTLRMKPFAIELRKFSRSLSDDVSQKLATILLFEAYKNQDPSQALFSEYFLPKRPLQSNRFEHLLFQATEKLYKRDYEQLRKFSEAALSLNSGHSLSRAMLPFANAKLGNASGIDQLKILYDSQGNYPAGFFLLQLYLEAKKIQETLALSRLLLKLDPNNRVIQLSLASVFLEREQWKEALNLYSGLLKRYPGEAEYKFQIAKILRKQGRGSESKRILESLLLATNINFSKDMQIQIQLERGGIDYDAKKYADAVRYFEVAHRMDDKNPQALRLLCDALLRSGRARVASQVIDAAQSKEPNSKELMELAWPIYSLAKNFPKAEATLQALLDMNTNKEPKLFYELAKMQEQRGDKVAALESYKKAVGLDPTFLQAKNKVMELTPAPLPATLSK